MLMETERVFSDNLIQVGTTQSGQDIDWFVEDKAKNGLWKQQTIPAEIVGLSRPLSVFRASRKTSLITYDWHGDSNTFCPPIWWDLAIGSGACGLGCRACFLMLTHRIMRDPWRHLLYDNIEDFVIESEKWLNHPKRRKQHTLGVGIDRSDSLLYEGVTEQIRLLAPLFGNEKCNPLNCKLILLTKSVNTQYLADIVPSDRKNVVVSFSLNPEPIADMWEGKWPDGIRITPSILKRLEAAKFAQDLGFEVRVRVDPILTPTGWEEYYSDFVKKVVDLGISFRYWTLGTYREKSSQLQAWADKWGLLPMEWQPDESELIHDGTHWHLSMKRRLEIYRAVSEIIRGQFKTAKISLCKETHSIRKSLNLCNADCNCLS